MRVLVLGGTGAMGVHLVDLLVKKGVEVVVTSRSKNESKGNLEYIQGNAKDLEFIKPILNKQWDVIVDFMVYTTDMFKSRYQLFLEKTSQYIFLSSARVYANSNNPLVENSNRLLDVSKDLKYLETDEYALSKARQEDILINSSFSNWTIIRPYITYSNTRLQLGVLEKESWLYRALKGRTILFSKDIYSRLTTLTFGFDVSKAISNLVGFSKSYGQIYHITTNDSMSWKEVLDIYLSVIENNLGFKPKILLQNTNDFLQHHSGKYQVTKDRVFDRKFNSKKISEFIDLNSFTKMEDGLRDCLNEFLKAPNFKAINWKTEALKDKKTKEIASLNEIKGKKQKIKYLLYRFILN